MTDALRQWVATESGLEAIWVHPNAPRPERPYCTLQITDWLSVGLRYQGPPDSNGEAKLDAQREVVVSISVLESSDSLDPRAALQKANALRDSLEKPSVRETLAASGWALRGVEMLADAPQLLETQWQPRAIFDVRFGTTQTILDDVGYVESVQGEATFNDTTSPWEVS